VTVTGAGQAAPEACDPPVTTASDPTTLAADEASWTVTYLVEVLVPVRVVVSSPTAPPAWETAAAGIVA